MHDHRHQFPIGSAITVSSLAYPMSEVIRHTKTQSVRVSTQTQQESHCQATQTATASRLPRLPNTGGDFQRPIVVLNSRKRLMRHFSETPSHTVRQLIHELLFKVNPCGRGCCPLHISLLSLKRSVSYMIALGCRPDFLPGVKWQCTIVGLCMARSLRTKPTMC